MSKNPVQIIRGWHQSGLIREPTTFPDNPQTQMARMCTEFADVVGDKNAHFCFYLTICGDFCGALHFAKQLNHYSNVHYIHELLREIVGGRTGLRNYDEFYAYIRN